MASKNEARKVQTRVCPVCNTVHDLPLCDRRSEERRKPTTLRECRTFGDLMEFRAPSTGYLHHCKRCRVYGPDIPHWHYSVRASICEACAIQAKDEILPAVATAERKARRWINAPDRAYTEADARFLASISGASVEYVESELRKRSAKAHHAESPVTGQDMIAALFVQTGGHYFGLDGVDAWDEARDARKYAGPFPVVAHPPCQRWGKMWFGQPLTVKLTGVRKVKGDDGGCFASALASVRAYGGVLEHPEGSHAWAHFGLHKPPRAGGWIVADSHGGWTCCVEQGRYGHYARKPTWLYAVGCALPELDWGKSEARLDPAVVARMGLKRAKRLGEVGARGGGTDSTPRIHTPAAFRDLLLSIARTAPGQAQEIAA